MRPVTGSSASQVSAPPRPITFHFVTAGWPSRIVLHPPATRFVEAAERQLDHAVVGLRRAFDDGPIRFVDVAGLEQPAELRERLMMAAKHEAPGGIAVEPVRQRRRARQSEPQRVEMVFQALAAFGTAMHGETCRLVDHQHEPIAVQEPRHHLFRGHGCLPWRNRYHGRGMNDSVKGNWWQRLTGGLKRTSSALGGAISDLVTKRKLDAATIAGIEDVLIRADLGLDTASRIAAALRDGRYEAGISPDEVKAVVAAEIEKALAPVAQPLAIDAAKKPFVILVAGVNGSGKTTTIGKLAAKLRAEGRTVMLAAGDTFRAAAIDQLKIWGERTGMRL